MIITEIKHLNVRISEFEDPIFDEKILPVFTTPLILKEVEARKKSKYKIETLNPEKKLTFKIVSFNKIVEELAARINKIAIGLEPHYFIDPSYPNSLPYKVREILDKNNLIDETKEIEESILRIKRSTVKGKKLILYARPSWKKFKWSYSAKKIQVSRKSGYVFLLSKKARLPNPWTFLFTPRFKTRYKKFKNKNRRYHLKNLSYNWCLAGWKPLFTKIGKLKYRGLGGVNPDRAIVKFKKLNLLTANATIKPAKTAPYVSGPLAAYLTELRSGNLPLAPSAVGSQGRATAAVQKVSARSASLAKGRARSRQVSQMVGKKGAVGLDRGLILSGLIPISKGALMLLNDKGWDLDLLLNKNSVFQRLKKKRPYNLKKLRRLRRLRRLRLMSINLYLHRSKNVERIQYVAGLEYQGRNHSKLNKPLNKGFVFQSGGQPVRVAREGTPAKYLIKHNNNKLNYVFNLIGGDLSFSYPARKGADLRLDKKNIKDIFLAQHSQPVELPLLEMCKGPAWELIPRAETAANPLLPKGIESRSLPLVGGARKGLATPVGGHTPASPALAAYGRGRRTEKSNLKFNTGAGCADAQSYSSRKFSTLASSITTTSSLANTDRVALKILNQYRAASNAAPFSQNPPKAGTSSTVGGVTPTATVRAYATATPTKRGSLRSPSSPSSNSSPRKELSKTKAAVAASPVKEKNVGPRRVPEAGLSERLKASALQSALSKNEAQSGKSVKKANSVPPITLGTKRAGGAATLGSSTGYPVKQKINSKASSSPAAAPARDGRGTSAGSVARNLTRNLITKVNNRDIKKKRSATLLKKISLNYVNSLLRSRKLLLNEKFTADKKKLKPSLARLVRVLQKKSLNKIKSLAEPRPWKKIEALLNSTISGPEANPKVFWSIIKLYSSSFNPMLKTLNNPNLGFTGLLDHQSSSVAGAAQIKYLKSNTASPLAEEAGADGVPGAVGALAAVGSPSAADKTGTTGAPGAPSTPGTNAAPGSLTPQVKTLKALNYVKAAIAVKEGQSGLNISQLNRNLLTLAQTETGKVKPTNSLLVELLTFWEPTQPTRRTRRVKLGEGEIRAAQLKFLTKYWTLLAQTEQTRDVRQTGIKPSRDGGSVTVTMPPATVPLIIKKKKSSSYGNPVLRHTVSVASPRAPAFSKAGSAAKSNLPAKAKPARAPALTALPSGQRGQGGLPAAQSQSRSPASASLAGAAAGAGNKNILPFNFNLFDPQIKLKLIKILKPVNSKLAQPLHYAAKYPFLSVTDAGVPGVAGNESASAKGWQRSKKKKQKGYSPAALDTRNFWRLKKALQARALRVKESARAADNNKFLFLYFIVPIFFATLKFKTASHMAKLKILNNQKKQLHSLIKLMLASGSITGGKRLPYGARRLYPPAAAQLPAHTSDAGRRLAALPTQRQGVPFIGAPRLGVAAADLLKLTVLLIARSLSPLKRKQDYYSLIFIRILETRGLLALGKKNTNFSRPLSAETLKNFKQKTILPALPTGREGAAALVRRKTEPRNTERKLAKSSQDKLFDIVMSLSSISNPGSRKAQGVPVLENKSCARASAEGQFKNKAKPTTALVYPESDPAKQSTITFYSGGRFLSEWKRITRVIWQEDYKFKAVYLRVKNSLNLANSNINDKLKAWYAIIRILRLWNTIKISSLKSFAILKLRVIFLACSSKLAGTGMVRHSCFWNFITLATRPYRLRQRGVTKKKRGLRRLKRKLLIRKVKFALARWKAVKIWNSNKDRVWQVCQPQSAVPTAEWGTVVPEITKYQPFGLASSGREAGKVILRTDELFKAAALQLNLLDKLKYMILDSYNLKRLKKIEAKFIFQLTWEDKLFYLTQVPKYDEAISRLLDLFQPVKNNFSRYENYLKWKRMDKNIKEEKTSLLTFLNKIFPASGSVLYNIKRRVPFIFERCKLVLSKNLTFISKDKTLTLITLPSRRITLDSRGLPVPGFFSRVPLAAPPAGGFVPSLPPARAGLRRTASTESVPGSRVAYARYALPAVGTVGRAATPRPTAAESCLSNGSLALPVRSLRQSGGVGTRPGTPMPLNLNLKENITGWSNRLFADNLMLNNEFKKSFNNLVNAKSTVIGKIRSIKLVELIDKLKEDIIIAEKLAALVRVADITKLNFLNKKKSRRINASKYLDKKKISRSNRIKILHTIETIKTEFRFEPKLDSNSLSNIPVSLLYYSNLKQKRKEEQEKPPVISDYLRQMSIYNRETKGIINSFSKIVGYNFNTNTNKISSSIYELLEASFKAMRCLISKPVFVITPKKITIQLFYFLLVANKNRLRKIRSRRSLYQRKRKVYKKSRLKLAKKLNLLGLNLVYPKHFELLCGRLNKVFNKPVELNLIRLHYPSEDTNILVNLMGLIVNKVKLMRIFKKLFAGSIIRTLTKIKKQKFNDITIFPAFLTGLSIKVAGRVMTQRIKPRKTINQIRRGVTASGKINYLNFARLTNKNKRGSYSITISAGQNYFK